VLAISELCCLVEPQVCCSTIGLLCIIIDVEDDEEEVAEDGLFSAVVVGIGGGRDDSAAAESSGKSAQAGSWQNSSGKLINFIQIFVLLILPGLPSASTRTAEGIWPGSQPLVSSRLFGAMLCCAVVEREKKNTDITAS